MNPPADTLGSMIDQVPTLAWSCRPDGTTEFLNQRWLDYTGLSHEDSLGWGWKNAIHPTDLDKLMATWLRVLASGEPGEEEARLRRFDGTYRWFLFRAVPARDEEGKIVRWCGTNTDIEDRKRAEDLLAGENRLLEMLAGGSPLGAILDGLCRLIETQAEDCLCGILLVDGIGECFRHGAGPSLPTDYNDALHGRLLNLESGPCAMAACLKKQVVAADVAADGRWEASGWRDLALRHGLLACWSTPILAAAGMALGTFAIYSRAPGEPTAEHQRLIAQVTHLAAVAIEQRRAEEQLRQSEHELRRLMDAVPLHIFVLGPDGDRLYSNRVARQYHGLGGEQPETDQLAAFAHPQDRERALGERSRLIALGKAFEFEARLRGNDGEYRWFLIRGNPLRDETGRIIRWYGTRTDIEDRKRAEERIRQDERELRQLIEVMPQNILVLGADRKPLYANQSLLDYHGVSLEDVQADDFRARVYHPDDLERVLGEAQRASAEETAWECEVRLRRKDGQYRWFVLRASPLRDESGRITRWYSIGFEIEERKQAEERVLKENLALREEIDHSSMFEEIVGSSPALRQVLAQVARVAPVDSTVLILGETGTGKELVARAIHKRSNRAARAFVGVNCAAIPPSLIASELFGHEKGAFTGALQRRLGRFELADGGTIFLDEIGELPAETQIALLRVLQEREIERVGGSGPIAVDVRVLAATNRDLKAAVAAGRFREDLFYRLNVFPIEIPSLRERIDDMPLLVEYFIERYGKKAGKKIKNIRRKTIELFQGYDWPGNIRELQNVIERAIVLCDGDNFSVDATWLRREEEKSTGAPHRFAANIAEREKQMIQAALTASRGRIAGPAGAAVKLGIPRQTLESKIKMLGIDKHRFRI